MSEKLPRVTATEIIKIVEKLGFRFSRQSGSHKIYKNDEKVRTVLLNYLLAPPPRKCAPVCPHIITRPAPALPGIIWDIH